MKNLLELGLTASGKPFGLPHDAVTQTFAILAMRGAGKTVTASVFAEEMCKASLPWIAFDPVGVWWGFRAKPDGTPSGFPVVVIGGQHADIPLEKNAGGKIAEALASENIFAVIDVSQESKHTWRQFLTEFSLGLMQMNPDVPRHLFIEEAPEFVPQRTKVMMTAQCKEAIERLVRLGRNRGYGCTLISQRPATVDKDVLSQCENLFVLRTSGPHDRQALSEWIEGKAAQRGLEKFLVELPGLATGTAWYWSPHWMNTFERVRIRDRQTFHPGATRQVGVAPKAVAMGDVGQFVERLRHQLTKRQVSMSAPKKFTTAAHEARVSEELEREERSTKPYVGLSQERRVTDFATQADMDSLRAQLADERARRVDAEKRLVAVRDSLRPQYDALKTLFDQLGSSSSANGAVDASIYEPWLAKAGKKGCRRLLETLIQRPELSRVQLGTLSNVSYKSSTFRAYMSWLKSNGLITTDGDIVRLQQV